MPDPKAMEPYHDPYDEPYIDVELFNFMSGANPCLSDLTLNDLNVDCIAIPSVTNNPPVIDNPMALNNSDLSVISYPNDKITNVDSPLDDLILPWIDGGAENTNVENFGPCDDGNSRNFVEYNWQTEYVTDGGGGGDNSVPLPFLCNCCQVLRELIHTKGQYVTRLEVHGSIGLICHGVLEIQPNNAANPAAYQYQLIDFSQKTLEEVEQHLQQYCIERTQAKFVMVKDPLAAFYKTICIGLDSDKNTINDNQPIDPPTSLNPAPAEVEEPEATKAPEKNKKKSALAAQRERTGKLTMKDVKKYFHLPIQEAARRLNLCPTVVKKICRKGGLYRWPHRKLKSIERRIASKKGRVRSHNLHEKANAEAEVKRLEQEIHKIHSLAVV